MTSSNVFAAQTAGLRFAEPFHERRVGEQEPVRGVELGQEYRQVVSQFLQIQGAFSKCFFILFSGMIGWQFFIQL